MLAAQRIELVWTDPWQSDEQLLAATPLSKVPVLIAEDGAPLVESSCICDYLDQLDTTTRLMPQSGAERLQVLRKYGLGRGLIDAAFGSVIQQRYGGDERALLASRWRSAVARTIAALEPQDLRSDTPDLGDLTIAVALSYIDFRMNDLASQGLSVWGRGLVAFWRA